MPKKLITMKVNPDTHKELTEIARVIYPLVETEKGTQPSAPWLVEYITPHLSESARTGRLYYDALVNDSLRTDIVQLRARVKLLDERNLQSAKVVQLNAKLLQTAHNELQDAKEKQKARENEVSELHEEIAALKGQIDGLLRE